MTKEINFKTASNKEHEQFFNNQCAWSKNGTTVYTMSDGKNLYSAIGEAEKNYYEKQGMWVAKIFENGHPVDF